MIDMYSKYDNMYKNGMFDAFICINNHVIIYINCMLSIIDGNLVVEDGKSKYHDKRRHY